MDGSVASLAPTCHVLLDARPAGEEVLPRHLVSTRISWFGEEGPYAHFAATDVTCRALAGVFACIGPKDGPPSMLGGMAGEAMGGIAAFIASTAALWGGGGRRMEASIHEANIAIAEYQADQPARRLPLQGRVAWRHHRHARAVARLLRDGRARRSGARPGLRRLARAAGPCRTPGKALR